MFGKNGIVGRGFFSDAAGKLQVTSVFATLQGEGPFRGKLCVFVRLAKCQLACYFCDTYFDSGDWLSMDELDEKIEAAIAHVDIGDTPRSEMGLVITGGEPSLQANSLIPYLERAASVFAWTQIETNGLATMPGLPDSVVLVVSPKCLEKNGLALRYYNLPFQTLQRANALKFVMCDDTLSPYGSIPQWALDWRTLSKGEIFVSPMNIYNDEPRKAKMARAEGRDLSLEERSVIDEVVSFWEPKLLNMEANHRNHAYAARYAMRHNLIFQVQLHLLADLA